MFLIRIVKKTRVGRRIMQIRLFFRDFFRAIARITLLPPVDSGQLDVLVVSPGGVATSELIRQLSKYVRVNHFGDDDRVKHLPRPPRYRPPTIFVMGDPKEISASINRRGWLSEQGAKLGSIMTVLIRDRRQKNYFERAVEKQMDVWVNEAGRASDIKLIKYDEIWDNLQSIASFAGIVDPKFVEEFPARRSRLSQISVETTSDG